MNIITANSKDMLGHFRHTNTVEEFTSILLSMDLHFTQTHKSPNKVTKCMLGTVAAGYQHTAHLTFSSPHSRRAKWGRGNQPHPVYELHAQLLL